MATQSIDEFIVCSTIAEVQALPLSVPLALCVQDGHAYYSATGTWKRTGPSIDYPLAMSAISAPVKSQSDAISDLGGVSALATNAALVAHSSRVDNPHVVTASQVGAPTTAQFNTLSTTVNNLPRERRLYYAKNLVSMNALLADVAVFTGLPSIYRIDSLIIYRPSTSLATVAKIGLFSGIHATGTPVVASQLVSCALGAVSDLTITAGIKNAAQSFPTLYLNNSVALGTPATASYMLCLIDLSD